MEKKQNIAKEIAIVITVAIKGTSRELIESHLDELVLLAETANAIVVERFLQFLPKRNPKTIMGKGKLYEIKEFIEENDIKTVIFDDEISPAQMKNIENILKTKVIDRPGLILDIFARNARSKEAKIQVELAQSQYIISRLTRMWTHLSKQYGGIGTKGPGETQIETDRRILGKKITKLKEKLDEIKQQKEQQKKGREELPRFALVGYTNAGKSTLMNAISEAEVLTEDKLFATLDTTVRTFQFENGQKSLISDTVGFIRKLPAHLIASFRSTLAEADDADVILHVIDITSPYLYQQIQTVNSTLEFLKIDNKPQIMIFNKIDSLVDKEILRSIEIEYPNAIMISAKRGINIVGLLQKMQELYNEDSKIIEFILPFNAMHLLNDIYKLGNIQYKKDFNEGIKFKIIAKKDKLEYFKYLLDEEKIIRS